MRGVWQKILQKEGGIIMKCNELMVGDWVLIDNTPHKIQAIDSIDAQIQADDELYYVGEDRHHSEDKIESILLTYEILKKNGWKDAEFWCEYQEGNNSIQACLPDMRGIINEVEIKEFQCKYVHQYQHLLRLCGLDELADNFKV